MQKPSINALTRENLNAFNEIACAFGDDGPNMLNVYQATATKSAVYPGQGSPAGLAYVALKLNGEAGEFAEHVGKAFRDDGLWFGDQIPVHAAMTPERRDALIKELGDVLWYIAAASKELGLSLTAVASRNLEKLVDRAERDALQGSGDNR